MWYATIDDERIATGDGHLLTADVVLPSAGCHVGYLDEIMHVTLPPQTGIAAIQENRIAIAAELLQREPLDTCVFHRITTYGS